MGVLAEHSVTVTARVTDLSSAGPALALWDITKRGDRKAGPLTLLALDNDEVVASAAALTTWLLRQGGHHHERAHDVPGDVPALTTMCPPPDLAGPPCSCGVVAAGRLLTPLLAAAPRVVGPLRQMVTQFEQDPTRSSVRLANVNVVQIMALVEGAGCLVTKRWGVDAVDLLGEARAAMLANLTGASPASRCWRR